MAGRAVLHIGTMKTGTTFLQSVLLGNKEALAERGIAVPATFARQTKAVNGVLRSEPGDRGGTAAWNRLVRLAGRAPEHTAVLSMEFLSFARGQRVSSLVEPFEKHGFDELEVVLTVRDQFRVLPAQWQTFCRNTGTTGWSDYLRVIEQTRLRPGGRAHARAHRTFHRAQDVPEILQEWAAARGVRRIHVVTLPPPTAPRDELWRRFCDILGASADGLDLEVAWENVSLGHGSCDLLRRVNVHLQDVPGRSYRAGMRALARGALVALRDQESRPQLDGRGARFAVARNQAIRDAVEEGSGSGSKLLLRGDLDELPVGADVSGFPSRVSDPPESEVWAAGEAARAFLCRASGAAATDVTTLDALAADVARLLRVANGW